MANETKVVRIGNGTALPIDTEITANGEYPVMGKGVKSYVDTKAEKVANKVTSLSAESTDVQYPSAKCVYDLIAALDARVTALEPEVEGGDNPTE